MDSIHEVKEALSARSRTATLDQLHNEGRQKVRIIRAEHIAEMIAQAVQRAVQESGLIPQDEVDALVERSREEFKDIVREREEERSELDQLRQRLDQARTENDGLRSAMEDLTVARSELEVLTAERDALGRELAELQKLRSESEQNRAESERLRTELARAQQELDSLRQAVVETQQTAEAAIEAAQLEAAQLAQQAAQDGAPSAAELERVANLERRNDSLQEALDAAMARTEQLAAEMQSLRDSRERRASSDQGGNAELMMKLMEEVVQLKQRGAGDGAAAAQAAPASGAPGADAGADLQGMLSQLTGALNDRLDKFGRKMGISSAVDASEIKFDSLFNNDDDSNIETNMDDVVVKQKKGGGIGANLERLRKLKGGG